MAVAVIAQPYEEPAYITYLLNPEVTHDFYYVVRNQQSGQTERVGVVKKMLMAHSEVLRSELGDSQLAMQHEADLEDLYSNTLRNLLRYVYGYDIITTLNFDDADNLLYVAEKYMMAPLKNKLATRLMSLLNYDNLCSLLNNPACFRHLELNSEITKILQFKTSEVFASPRFLEISSTALVKILEQDRMNVEEIEVWRAALKWAKHKASTEYGAELRAQLSEHVKLIRFCTLNPSDLCKEVLPSNVLSNDEFHLACRSLGLQHKQSELIDICINTERRTKLVNVVAKLNVGLFKMGRKESIFKIVTKNFGISLLSLGFKAIPYSSTSLVATTIYISNISSATGSLLLKSHQNMTSGEVFSLPVSIDATEIELLPYSTYQISVKLSEVVEQYQSNNEVAFDNNHITVKFDKTRFEYGDSYYISIINELVYRPLT